MKFHVLYTLLTLKNTFLGFERKNAFPITNFKSKSLTSKKTDIYSSGSNDYFKTINQENYMKALKNTNVSIVCCVGPAGTGKTLFACTSAVEQYMKGKIQKIILTRPMIAVEDEDLGFLPGNIAHKMFPWTRPMFDVFSELLSKKHVDSMVQQGVIEISPLAYMRGLTFKNTFVIADEMQNCSPNQMLMLTTRMGEESKLVITGDLHQSDLDRVAGSRNGLDDFIKKYEDYSKANPDEKRNIQVIRLDDVDIKRSEVVKTIMRIYNS
jgi:phosphate starvation-inducible PhoH-like protein